MAGNEGQYCSASNSTMVSIKAIIFVAFLAAVAAAQRGGHHIPAISRVAYIPAAPMLPSEFTAAISEHTNPAQTGEEIWVEGYYYYSAALEAIQIDYTVPGGFVTELVQDGVLTVGTLSGGSISCVNGTDPIPFLPPNILESFDFLGVSVSPEGRPLYSWGRDLYGLDLVILTDAQTGALVYEFGQTFSIQFLSFDEGVPSTVFRESCGANNDTPQDLAPPETFLLSRR